MRWPRRVGGRTRGSSRRRTSSAWPLPSTSGTLPAGSRVPLDPTRASSRLSGRRGSAGDQPVTTNDSMRRCLCLTQAPLRTPGRYGLPSRLATTPLEAAVPRRGQHPLLVGNEVARRPPAVRVPEGESGWARGPCGTATRRLALRRPVGGSRHVAVGCRRCRPPARCPFLRCSWQSRLQFAAPW
jgi:hypothetical protein